MKSSEMHPIKAFFFSHYLYCTHIFIYKSYSYKTFPGLIIPAWVSCVTSAIISIRRKLSHRPVLFPTSPPLVLTLHGKTFHLMINSDGLQAVIGFTQKPLCFYCFALLSL